MNADEFFEENSECFDFIRNYIPCSKCGQSIDVTNDKYIPSGWVECCKCAMEKEKNEQI